ncbi:MAG: SRPBCC domain-containing protein [Acidobacteriota bacterium]|nr:MAG: SRPBCC domain-containing protein [Acidobacteriota bacterium]
MPDIFHQFPVFAPAHEVFKAVSAPEGLDGWWTLSSKGEPAAGNIYELFFGEGYDWRARVTECVPNELFELEIYGSMPDWENTRVRFELAEEGTSPVKSVENSEGEVSEDGSGSSDEASLSASSAQSAAETIVRFSHTGWPNDNDHYRISSFCWAMYLRLMKKYVEDGTVVEYSKRLDA